MGITSPGGRYLFQPRLPDQKTGSESLGHLLSITQLGGTLLRLKPKISLLCPHRYQEGLAKSPERRSPPASISSPGGKDDTGPGGGAGTHQQRVDHGIRGLRDEGQRPEPCLYLVRLHLPGHDEVLHEAHTGLGATGRQGVHQRWPEIKRHRGTSRSGSPAERLPGLMPRLTPVIPGTLGGSQKCDGHVSGITHLGKGRARPGTF